MAELRDYQHRAITNLRTSLLRGAKAPLFVLPTGGGKTAIAAELVRAARDKGKPVLFLAPRRELIYQASHRLEVSGIYHGIVMSGEPVSRMPSVQVASIATLYARCVQRDTMEPPPAALVIVDEAHIGIGGRAQSILEYYRMQGAVIVGLTATPARSDGRALGMVYDDLVEGPTIQDLIDGGYLVRPRYFAGSKPDLTGVKVQAGDYQQTELAERTDQPTLVGDVVENWARLAEDRQTFVFSVNRAHSRHLAERFKAIGVAAEHIDGETDLEERKAIHERLQSGETQVVCNCQIYTYGVDYPPVSCIVLAAPTKSLPKYMQMVGRGLRTFDGKADCLVLDHAGCIDECGRIEEPMPWTLAGKEKIQDRKARERKEPRELTCPDCSEVFAAQKHCPGCGREMKAEHQQAIAALEAELTEIDEARRRAEKRQWTMDRKIQFFGELKAYAMNQGYKPGWAAHAFQERTGVWPNDPRVKGAKPQHPSKETLGWITHRKIKRAKSQEAA